MARLKGLGSFAMITVAVLLGLRLLHDVTPLVFPATRLGPIDVSTFDDARRLVGFAPMAPAYRPATLGDRPVSMTVTLSPRPTFQITWRADGQFLTVTQRQGGSRPADSPVSEPLLDVPNSAWWMQNDQAHLVLERGDFWIVIETSLSTGELKRFADTLSIQ
ncbi:MAG: hypothetical protein WCQ64_01680 [Acidobacteriota bacterium]